MIELRPFSWGDRPAEKGFHSIDAILEKMKASGGGEEIAEARKKLAGVYSKDGMTIKSLRLERGLSQAELAEAAGTNQYIVSCYERGKHEMLFTTMEKFAGALGVDLNTLGEAIKNTERKYLK